MLTDHQHPLGSRPVKDTALAGSSLLGHDVVDRDPVWVLKMEWIKHRVADVQQLLVIRGNGGHHMAGCVAGRRDDADAGQDFGPAAYEAHLVLERVRPKKGCAWWPKH